MIFSLLISTVFIRKKEIEIELKNTKFLQLPRFHNAEKYIAGRLKTLLQFPPEPISAIDQYISAIELANNIKYETLQKDAEKGYGAATYEGHALGIYKASDGMLKNHYPKGLRLLK